MSSPAYDLAQYLGSLSGVGTVASQSDWGIFVGTEPATPNNCITLYDTGGLMGNPDARMYDPTIQVRIRSVLYLPGHTKASQVRDALILPTSFSTDDWFYTGAWLISDVAKIGRDDNNRELFTVNFRLMRQPITSA